MPNLSLDKARKPEQTNNLGKINPSESPVEKWVSPIKACSSSGFIACAIFVAMNLGLLSIYEARTSMSSTAKHIACSNGSFSALASLHDVPLLMWALQNSYERILDSGLSQLNAESHPQVVLLGSSIMQLPTWFADQGDTLPDQAYYYFRSKNLEKKCATKRAVINLASPLTFASDIKRTVETYLVGSAQPDVVVYGVAPRDLFDNTIGEPSKSMYFSYLAKQSDYFGNSDAYFSNAVEGASGFILQGFSIFQKRKEIIELVKLAGKELLHRKKPVETAPVVSMDVKKNLDEYKDHYKNLSDSAIDSQLKFLDQMLETCSRRHIRALIVSMPLTNENKQLLPKRFYSTFNDRLAKLTDFHHQTFFCAKDSEFKTADFMDSVHLNARGSRKFIDLLAPQIRSEIASSQQPKKSVVSNRD